MNTPRATRLVLIGDIHASRLLVPPWRLTGKRLLGQVNLWMRRRHRFNLELLAPVLQRAVHVGPDLMLFSGDLTTTALEGEFEDVDAILRSVKNLPPTLIVPGNHDRYTFTAARRRLIEHVFPHWVPTDYPDVRPLNQAWRLMALDASVPRLVSSRGGLDPAQRRAAETVIRSIPANQGLIVLCHYPIVVPESVRSPWEHRLADAQAWRNAVAASRANVVWLHGHVHMPWHWRSSDPRLSRLTNVNAGSPTLIAGPTGLGHGFWQIDVPADADRPVSFVRHEPSGDGPNSDGWTCHDVP